MDQLEGTLTSAIAALDASLFDLVARLEASLDFPEEGFHFITREDTALELATVCERIEALIRDGRAGRVLREGRMVVIIGRPNAGKSTLFNALVGASRAIVTDVAGTTRDLLTERVDVGGLPITLVDSAGLRDARDAIEAEGVKRAEAARDAASLTLFVVDQSQPLEPAERAMLAENTATRIVVASKSDLPSGWSELEHAARAVRVSAETGHGLDQLRARIVDALTDREEWRDPPAVSNIRHISLLTEALVSIEQASDALHRGGTEEMVVAELGQAREALEAIAGRRAPEDLLRHIFGSFCIGK
jgi:tRNA modification GTPase